MNQKPPTGSIWSAHAELVDSLPMADTADFADADRGVAGIAGTRGGCEG
jgi:linear primary-alkylsulfatase